ncbi:hypothetical protein H9Q74_001209 [Fusarium xylarioides]|nr:hypothetical protein H9Q71_001146 [Fusarium xylarioides]KAG5828734.1 hypothetical protein H9Q74_001209 [Fusarium xylarioides]
MSQWLPLAIKFYLRLRADVFVIQHDGGLSSPQLEKKTFMNKKDWFVRINMSVDKPRLVDRIKSLEPPMNGNVAMSGLNDFSGSELGDSDSSELVTLTVTTTRAEATQKAGNPAETISA